MTHIKFTADLLALIQRQNLCETQAAGLLGVPVFTLKKWTSAQRAPSASAVRLLEVLGLLEAVAPALLDALTPGPVAHVEKVQGKRSRKESPGETLT
tara:strand:+ start:1186 stop:1476 length:291 start_codon:yes stop_codon:yes gene_type:complete